MKGLGKGGGTEDTKFCIKDSEKRKYKYKVLRSEADS